MLLKEVHTSVSNCRKLAKEHVNSAVISSQQSAYGSIVKDFTEDSIECSEGRDCSMMNQLRSDWGPKELSSNSRMKYASVGFVVSKP